MNSHSDATPQSETLFTAREVAAILKVSLYTLRAMTRAGKIPCVRLSQKTIRYRMSDIDSIVKAGRGEVIR